MKLEYVGGARLWILVAGIAGTKATLLGKSLSKQSEGRVIAVGWISNSTNELTNTQIAQLSEE